MAVVPSWGHSRDRFACYLDLSHANLVACPTVPELLFCEKLNFFLAEFVEFIGTNRGGGVKPSTAGIKALEAGAGFKTSCVQCYVILFFVVVVVAHDGKSIV